MTLRSLRPKEQRLGGCSLRRSIARAYPRLVGAVREKSWIFFEIFLPLLAVAAYVFIYRALQAPEEYVGFVVVGGAMTAFWMNILWSMSSQLYWEKEKGNLALYIMAPNSMMAVLLGMAVGGSVYDHSLRAVVILILGSWFFSVDYAVSSYWQLALVFTLTMVALYGMGMMSASVFLLLSREAWHISNLAQEPVFLVSGFYFPVKNLIFGSPSWLRSSPSPWVWTLCGSSLSLGASSGFLPVPVEAAMLAVLSVVFLVGARWLLAYMERLAIREGRLTESRR